MVTKITKPDGTEGTRILDKTTGETRSTETRKDPKTGMVMQTDFTTDKFGKQHGSTTYTMSDDDPNNKGGQKIKYSEAVDGHITKVSEIHIRAKGDSSKTTNFDPTSNVKTSEVTVRPNGSTATTNYRDCNANG